jgi:S1-C subfamily serine protease
MKKSILFCAIVMMAFNQIAVAQGSESWYRNYFKEHIEELDPIEGIYSVYTVTTVVNVTQESHSTKFAVKKRSSYSGDYFEVVRLIQGTGAAVREMKFRRIGDNLTYEFEVTYTSEDKANSRVYLQSLFSFSTRIKVPLGAVKAILPKRFASQAHTITMYNDYEFTKDYPTRSMYNEAIAASQKKKEEEKPSSWSGTGWAIGSNYVVTNNHVTDGARTIKIRGVGGDGNTTYTAKVVATDKVNDLAILKIDDYRFPGFGSIPYSVRSNMAEVGEDVFVLGYPLTQYMGDEIKLTNGIISSRTGYQGDIANYQISAPIQPGNSGGPMFDNKGNVIGVVVAGVPGAENVGYAIKTSYLKILIESAGLTINFPTNNTLATLSLSEKVKRVKKFVFYIECSK